MLTVVAIVENVDGCLFHRYGVEKTKQHRFLFLLNHTLLYIGVLFLFFYLVFGSHEVCVYFETPTVCNDVLFISLSLV
jgi:hypothetical protein